MGKVSACFHILKFNNKNNEQYSSQNVIKTMNNIYLKMSIIRGINPKLGRKNKNISPET